MEIEQARWTQDKGWTPASPGKLSRSAQLVFLFGSTSVLEKNDHIEQIKQAYPDAHILGCSTAGEICGTEVLNDSLVVTAVCFEHTQLKGGQVNLENVSNSFHAGESLARMLDPRGLKHVLVVSDGLGVNGSELVRGLTRCLPEHVTVTGGLAADGERFQKTFTFWDGYPKKDSVAAVGFYGDQLKVGCGSMGGWDPFGLERLITRSKGNILYELDGRSALELYKKYLGEHSTGLPATGLLFPLSIRNRAGDVGLVRTILAVNERDHSITFAGDVPEGWYARFMKANFDRLIDGAIGAARVCYRANGYNPPDLAILISCVGRMLVLKQRAEDELEGVREVFGRKTVLSGFYSYGEISPSKPGNKSELHNQTMTITTFSE